jgi:hypothetical protein
MLLSVPGARWSEGSMSKHTTPALPCPSPALSRERARMRVLRSRRRAIATALPQLVKLQRNAKATRFPKRLPNDSQRPARSQWSSRRSPKQRRRRSKLFAEPRELRADLVTTTPEPKGTPSQSIESVSKARAQLKPRPAHLKLSQTHLKPGQTRLNPLSRRSPHLTAVKTQ